MRLAADTSLPPALQDRMIREADALTPDNPFDVRTLEGSHLRWLVRPKPAAELLAGLAGLLTPAPVGPAPSRPSLCDLDNVIRFYDTAPLAALERAAGLPEGTTTDIAYAPETDLPLLLGRITPDAWVESIAAGLTERVGADRAHELGRALADARVPGRRGGGVAAALGPGPMSRWSSSPMPLSNWTLILLCWA